MFWTYIVTNRPHGVLYTGHTDDLAKRISEHAKKTIPGAFTARYNCSALVWYQEFRTREEAKSRETNIKNWKRAWKIELIERTNPDWRTLRAP